MINPYDPPETPVSDEATNRAPTAHFRWTPLETSTLASICGLITILFCNGIGLYSPFGRKVFPEFVSMPWIPVDGVVPFILDCGLKSLPTAILLGALHSLALRAANRPKKRAVLNLLFMGVGGIVGAAGAALLYNG